MKKEENPLYLSKEVILTQVTQELQYIDYTRWWREAKLDLTFWFHVTLQIAFVTWHIYSQPYFFAQ